MKTIYLSRIETIAYEDTSPVGDRYRRTIRNMARNLANADGHLREIMSFNGIVFEAISVSTLND